MQTSAAIRRRKLLEIRAAAKLVLYDGSKGTFLAPSLSSVGKSSADLTEWLNLLAPEVVRRAHRNYIDAGSQIIQTNSFNGTRFRLEPYGLASKVRDVNLLSAQTAREAAGSEVFVAGVIGPTGKLLLLEEVAREELVRAFAEQAQALEEGGVDFFHVESMSDLAEAVAAVEAIRSVSALPIALTMSFDSGKVEKGLRTMMGVPPRALVEKGNELDLFAVGANCGLGLEGYQPVVRELVASAPRGAVIAKLNTMARMGSSQPAQEASPAEMAEYAVWCGQNGVQVVGACCSSEPRHIEAMAKALARLR